MTEFYRFPHTPHLAWLGEGTPRDDKVLSPDDVTELLSSEVVVEEKVDGANLGFSVDSQCTLRVQNRGQYLDLGTQAGGQFKLLSRWLSTHARRLEDALFPDLVLFGEWCYAVHGVQYSRLPDWFLAFDVYDRSRESFWSVERRDALARELGVAVVPRIGSGMFDSRSLEALLDRSRLTDGPPEGLYVRRESQGQLVQRAKLVRPEFVQAIEEHWSKRSMRVNSLAGPA